MFAAFLESTIFVGVIDNPSELESTIKRLIPSLSDSLLDDLHATIILSAKVPSSTKDFSPLIKKSSPFFSTEQDIFFGL